MTNLENVNNYFQLAKNNTKFILIQKLISSTFIRNLRSLPFNVCVVRMHGRSHRVNLFPSCFLQRSEEAFKLIMLTFNEIQLLVQPFLIASYFLKFVIQCGDLQQHSRLRERQNHTHRKNFFHISHTFEKSVTKSNTSSNFVILKGMSLFCF